MIKRLLDICTAAVGLVILAPLFALIAFLIRFDSSGPVFFRQERPGLHGKPFLLYKFRTMRNAFDKEGKPLPDEERLTRLGMVLRKTSMDELPELYNVLKGEMSLVGPRPLLMEYLNRYTLEEARRHEVKPGITGWAQINGRNVLSWKEKFQLDLWYVDNQSLGLDLKILLLTLWKVVRREGISHSGHATMPEFKGSGKYGSYER